MPINLPGPDDPRPAWPADPPVRQPLETVLRTGRGRPSDAAAVDAGLLALTPKRFAHERYGRARAAAAQEGR